MSGQKQCASLSDVLPARHRTIDSCSSRLLAPFSPGSPVCIALVTAQVLAFAAAAAVLPAAPSACSAPGSPVRSAHATMQILASAATAAASPAAFSVLLAPGLAVSPKFIVTGLARYVHYSGLARLPVPPAAATSAASGALASTPMGDSLSATAVLAVSNASA